MSTRAAAVWHIPHPTVHTEEWYQVVSRNSLKCLQAVGRFVRAFLEVEPIFLKRF